MVKKLLEKIAIIVDSTIFYSSALLGFVDKLHWETQILGTTIFL